MLILEAGNVKNFFGDRLILEFEELKVYSGDKIGIVGQNGSGKTTLLNILSKEISVDEGFVKHYCEISYIRQFSCEDIEANPKVLKEFGLNNKIHQAGFSGGEKTRIKIANALSSNNVVLFADEPTTNLDYRGINLLKQKLSGENSFLLICHDRSLLDSLCNKILEVKNGKIKLYNGNYSFYKAQQKKEKEREELEYEKYIASKTSIEEAIVDRKHRSKTMKKTPKRMGNSEARLHKRKTTEKQQKINNAVNSLKTRLEKLDVKENPQDLSKIKLDFRLTNPPENRIVISAEDLSFSYGNNIIFENARFSVYNGCKTALWGENGSGKTTLLNLISRGSSESIYVVPKAKIGYFHQEFENLDNKKSILDNVMSESIQTQATVRTILARLLFAGDAVYKKVDVLSGGEKIKVSFAKLFVSDANVLVLDEPTNYLDMESVEALEAVLSDYEGTVLFVSHDRDFVDTIADRLLVIENKAIIEFEGNVTGFTEYRDKSKACNLNETERVVLQMRITEIISKISMANADKDSLEYEYQNLIKQLKQ